MSLLIVLLPEQPRLSARPGDMAAPRPPAELDYVFSADGRQVGQMARGAPATWPKAQTVVAVLPPADVAWHRLTAPKAPAARLRLALAGMLEEVLLDDEADLHLAVSPGLKAGEPVWVAVIAKSWLAAQLESIEAAGVNVDRLVPAWGPDDTPAGHVYSPDRHSDENPGPWLAWRDADGPVCLPVASDATRALLARVPPEQSVRWSAAPDCAAEAARLAVDTVAAHSTAEFALAATRGEWNLRQFDLVPRRRGSRVAAEWWKRFANDPEWRLVRYGLVLLVAVQLIGANLWAWQQRQNLARQKAAMTQLLQTTFPNVRAVRDAPVQMQKEVELLRAAAGKPGESDLEPLLQAADAAWPPSRAPADSLKFEPGRLTISSPGWSPQEVDGFRARLRPLGFDAEAVPGRLTLTPYRAKPGDAPLAPPGGAGPATAPPPGVGAVAPAPGAVPPPGSPPPPVAVRPGLGVPPGAAPPPAFDPQQQQGAMEGVARPLMPTPRPLPGPQAAPQQDASQGFTAPRGEAQ